MGSGPWASRRDRYPRRVEPAGRIRSLLHRKLVNLVGPKNSSKNALGRTFAGKRVLTYHSRQWSAIDAVINAGRDITPVASTANRHPVSPRDERATQDSPDTNATLILLRILDAVSASPKPCIQFLACDPEKSAFTVATATSRAATTLLGPSLILNVRIDNKSGDDIEPRSCETVPDAFVHGLYHYDLAQRAAGLEPLSGRSQRIGERLKSLIAPFKFVALNSCGPRMGPAYSALTAMCAGTVLVVRAGESSRSVINEAALQVARAGSRVIGSVLDEAPGTLPGWIRRP